MLRRIRRSDRLRRWIALLGARYIRLIERTVRWQIPDPALRDRIRRVEEPWLVAVWHGRLLPVPNELPPGVEAHAMISANRDGDIIAQCIRSFGAQVMRGSSHDPRKPLKRKGGAAVAAEAMALLGSGRRLVVALTPDGPRGPRMRCQPGVAAVSAAAGVRVVPFAFSTSRGVVLGSWDRFYVPLPFGRGVKLWGEPIDPPAKASHEAIEAHRLAIEAALIDLTQRADRMMGRDPIQPEAPALGEATREHGRPAAEGDRR